MHASLGWVATARLVPLRDVLQVSAEGNVEWDVLARWGREWHLTAVLRHAFQMASATLDRPLPAEARHLLVATPHRRETIALRAYIGERREHGGSAVATLLAIPGVRDKAAYMRALVIPDRAFLTSRAGPGLRPSYVRRLAVPAGWLRSRLFACASRLRSGA